VFTGIVEELGTVREATGSSGRSGKITVSARKVLEGTKVGDSIAISGVCQTVVSMDGGAFTADVMPETLRRTTLGEMRHGDTVNLERALEVGGRLGGHIMNGHVDAVGTVRSRRVEENAVLFDVAVPGELSSYVVEKGSVGLDGISLTVVSSTRGLFTVSVIPRTLEETTLSRARPGTRLNVEVDVLAKYVESLLAGGRGGGLEGRLIAGGFMEGL
jgi:riboflavin synthase